MRHSRSLRRSRCAQRPEDSLKIVVFAATGSDLQRIPLFIFPVVRVHLRQKMHPTLPDLSLESANSAICCLSINVAPGNRTLSIVNSLMRPMQSFLGYFFPLADVRKCRAELERKAKLKLYTTTIAMDDLDEVRAALGYKQLNLYGASYGTRATLVYLRQHEASVRTAALFGVSPTNQFMPRIFPRDTERALKRRAG